MGTRRKMLCEARTRPPVSLLVATFLSPMRACSVIFAAARSSQPPPFFQPHSSALSISLSLSRTTLREGGLFGFVFLHVCHISDSPSVCSVVWDIPGTSRIGALLGIGLILVTYSSGLSNSGWFSPGMCEGARSSSTPGWKMFRDCDFCAALPSIIWAMLLAVSVVGTRSWIIRVPRNVFRCLPIRPPPPRTSAFTA